MTNSQKILHKQFAKEYIANGLNGKRAYMKVKKAKPQTSVVEASRLLMKPNVQNEIAKLLEENDLKVQDAIRIHKRNMLQDTQLSVSQTAVQDVYKLVGMYGSDSSKPSVTVGIVITE